MPFSDGSLRPWILEKIVDSTLDVNQPVQVVDVGAGAGLLLDYLRPWTPVGRWTAIEVWEPYLKQFHLRQRYDTVILGDVREVNLPEADLYLLGDVLEHLPREHALDVWNRIRERTRYLAASLPIVHYPQGPEFGNPHEEHLYHWALEEFLDTFPGVLDSVRGVVVGGFWAAGLRSDEPVYN